MGRIGSVLIAGAALFAGMVVQGDVNIGDEIGDHGSARVHRGDRGERDFDRRVDRIVDRATRGIDSRGDDDVPIEQNPVIRRQMVGAIAELLRAEISLANAKSDDKLPRAVLVQAEQRRDAAKLAVDRLADEAKAVSRDDRDEIREGLREEVRDAVRDGVRG
ncbi:MAG: hypothetical protein ABI617_00415 [Sphingomicrobium sp.]